DISVKSKKAANHIKHLLQSIRQNEECPFVVKVGNILGFLVHQSGLEIDKSKEKVILEVKALGNKKDLWHFLGQVNYLRRFISNLARKTIGFLDLLKLKVEEDFR